ncbi:uncharacterized protein LOC134670847 [Cydia fagiglandana]|uniref:uncharacterized protein LOC134670847 n=1 Tax=Cydia fagiglandana TaxID=1458189 RepID=UPI002FEE4281
MAQSQSTPSIMSMFNIPEKLNVSGNLSENWKTFEQNLKIYLVASGLDKSDDTRKVAILLNVIGEDGIKIYNNFALTTTEDVKFEDVMKKFKDYCEPKKNVLQSRFLFYTRKQEESEPFDSFLTDVKRLVKSCKFGAEEDDAVRDRLVLGTNDLHTQKKIVIEGDAELDMVITKLRLAELGRQHAAEVQGKVKVDKVIEKKSNSKPVHNNNMVLKCKWCGEQHERKLEVCPARGKLCTKCNRYNHYATVCRSKYVKAIADNQEDSDGKFYCGSVQKMIQGKLN